MPLLKGKKNIGKNIKTEEAHGRPAKQSLAIALNVAGIAKKKKKKMSDGGEVKKENYEASPAPSPSPDSSDWEKRHPKMKDVMGGLKKAFSRGGEVEPMDLMHDDERASSIADAIMRKRKAKMMSDGGEVELEENSEEMPNDFYGLNENAANEEIYDDSQLESQPEDSNMSRPDIESDNHDMVSKIRAKLRSLRGGV